MLPLFFSAILIGIVSYTVFTLNQQKADSTVINIAGRQRMLTQKFSKELLDELNAAQVRSAAIKIASGAGTQIVADRSYYTKHVIGKLKRDWPDFKASENHRSISGAIPYPATYVQEVADDLDRSAGYEYTLRSKWNINPDKGLSNDFERNAWDALSKNPDKPYSGLVQTERGVMLHYATADVAASGCANCHNGRGDSPKRDFEVGDLMGILVVSTLATSNPEISKALLAGKDQVRNSEKTGKLFDVSLEALRFGGITYADLGMTREVSLPGNEEAAIEEKLAEVASSWDELKIAARNVQQEKVNSSEYLRQLAIIRSSNLKTLKTMNQAVMRLADWSQKNTVSMMYAEGVILLISLIVGIVISLLLVRSFFAQLGAEPGQVQEIAQSIANGEFEFEISYQGKQPIGVLASMITMRDNLKERIEADALVAQANGRIKTALDSVGANVMLADVDMNIIYMNNAVTKMMKDAETKLRESLPGFDADKLIGANIDSFHKNPSHQRALLADLKTPYQGTAEISGLTFKVIANPVFGDDGERIGTVVE
ncbi:MAG: DUF3365 domain-containing protein, partial [Aestuariibacter sp.]|nr:DUF3365 domain-containing protein [Aestuariibacter sp.]